MALTITQSDEGRFYNGYPSVTTVIDILREPYLERWRGKVGNEEADRISNEAKWLGTLIHDTLTTWEIHGGEIHLGALDPGVRCAVEAYRKWKSEVLDSWVIMEQSYVSAELGVGGTVDRVGVLKGESDLTLVDFKTGHPSDKYRYQTAGYKLLLAKHGIHIARRILLYLPTSPNSKVYAKEHTNHAIDELGFTLLRDLYRVIHTTT